MILMDTCSLIWLECDQSKLSSNVTQALAEPGAAVFVSVISAFEIGLKIKNGELELPRRASEWVTEVCKRRDIRVLPLDIETAGLSTELPEIHRDPCDRFLVAAARIAALRIATPDKKIRQYPGIEVVW